MKTMHGQGCACLGPFFFLNKEDTLIFFFLVQCDTWFNSCLFVYFTDIEQAFMESCFRPPDRFLLCFWFPPTIGKHTFHHCCSILQEEHLKANYVTTPRKGCPNLKAPPDAAHKCVFLFSLFGGCTATILHGLTYPKILRAPDKEERNRGNGDITWRRLSLSRAWAAEIVTSG